MAINTFDAIADVNLMGFQVVKGRLFAGGQEPYMTIMTRRISFNLAVIQALNRCEYIKMMVNNDLQSVLIIPSVSTASEAFCWTKSPEKTASAVIECSQFTRKIFEEWALQPNHYYKAQGRLVRNGDKVMMLFDFRDSQPRTTVKKKPVQNDG